MSKKFENEGKFWGRNGVDRNYEYTIYKCIFWPNNQNLLQDELEKILDKFFKDDILPGKIDEIFVNENIIKGLNQKKFIRTLLENEELVTAIYIKNDTKKVMDQKYILSFIKIFLDVLDIRNLSYKIFREYNNFVIGNRMDFPYLSLIVNVLLKIFGFDFDKFLQFYFQFGDKSFQRYLDGEYSINNFNFTVVMEIIEKKDNHQEALDANFFHHHYKNQFKIDLAGVDVIVKNQYDVLCILKEYSKFYLSDFNKDRGWTGYDLIRFVLFNAFMENDNFEIDTYYNSVNSMIGVLDKYNEDNEPTLIYYN
tara:strand:+ start:8873 stop:9799 length:927 start_codon:yes stop_codon:yes gene_type:complete